MFVGTFLFMMGKSLGITVAHTVPPYVSSLFSTEKVHTLDIVVNKDDWAEMLANATAKEYVACNVVIDGEAVNNVGIRTKGNSSLSSIAMSDSDRYSFKVEFDHYIGAQTYQGLDKLSLNNIAQDNTYLKDYVSYQMMNAFEADAPLSSFVYITVNGEEWGLYLAVEGIEESFASRNYGSDYGEIYKPDNMDMNAGQGGEGNGFPQMPDFEGGMPEWDGEMPEGFENGQFPGGEQMPEFPQDGETPDFQEPSGEDNIDSSENSENTPSRGGFSGFGGGNSSDIALIYTDDEHESYANIFDNSVFNPSNADKDTLIASIKQLNEGTNLEEVVNIDEVLRYFVVHNYLLNFDSYTGSMLHNYYLYEEDGVLSMIAWDYNLAFGAFIVGGGMGNSGSTDTATRAVNYPIDTPVSGVEMEDRPLLNELLSNETYLELYHSLFAEFISGYFDSGDFEKMYDNAVSLISPYVEKDPTAFCSYEEFTQAQEHLKEFCLLRAQSVKGQLDGTIGSTNEAQSETQSSGFIDASHIDMDAMGSNMMGFGLARGSNFQQSNNNEQSAKQIITDEPTEAGGAQGDFAPPNDSGGKQESSSEAPHDGEGFPFGGNNRPQNDGGGMQQMPGGNMEADPSANINQRVWLLVGTFILMAGGLLFAKLFKRW